ncbi:MAG: TonB-dependent receptor [Tenuifilaceae bacterium]|nr:TonB-dependent receptor [Tenuifilaceae bacterium]
MSLLCLSAVAQQKISGKVTSASDGMGIPGVSVIIKGTTTGTSTDLDGNYTISVPNSTDILQFTFVGMKSVEAIANQSIINVVMQQNDQELEEVVVVAYGVAKKESLTGAVSAVNAQAIEKRPVSSVTSALEGTVAGVQINNTYGEPGASPSIRIRGFTSVNGTNDPLYVIDGVPFGGNISDLNPQDIESISLLKDAASSALYGNRASNGVVLITTKKGKSESGSISFSASQGFYTRGIDEYERLGTDDYMEVMWKAYRNQIFSSTQNITIEEANATATANLIGTHLKYNLYNQPDNALFDANGKLIPEAKLYSGYNDLDWYKFIERVGHRQEYNVNADAASSKGSYFFSLGYLDEKGYLESSDYKRLTGRANVSITPRKWLKAGVAIAGSHQMSNNSSGSATSSGSFINPFNYARNMAPIYPVYLHDMATGELILDALGKKQYDRGGDYARPQNLDRHIVWETELNKDKTIRNTLQASPYIDFTFLKDFKFSIKGDINLRNNENMTYNNAIIGDGAGNNGRAKRDIDRYKNFTFQQQLSWSKQFDLHNVDLFFGHENYSWNYSNLYGYKTNEIYPDLMILNNFTQITSLDGYEDNYTLDSYLSRARYNYNNKYFAEASFRRDGSSRFHPNHRWGNFWSLGGSWIISKESFFAGLEDKINTLKLRASYGEVGNDSSVDYYAFMNLYAMNQNGNLGAAYKSQYEAFDIKWETSSSFGVALEGRFLDRINASVEYFDKRSQNLLFDVFLPLSAGANSTSSAEATVTKNLGTVSNTGIELIADVDLVRTDNFRWNIGVNATTLKNKLVTLPKENRAEGIVSGTKRYLEGHSIYDFWLYQYVGVDQMTGNALYLPDLDQFYIDTPEDGKTPIPSQYVVQINGKNYTTFTTYGKKDWSGSVIPDLFGSISNSFSYKGFDLSILLTYSLGGKTLDYSYQSLMTVSATPHALHKDVLNAWDGIPEGMTEESKNRIDKNGTPGLDFDKSSYNDALSTRFLVNSSYLVIKNVSLSYMLPKNLTSKFDASNLTLNASVENLATFTKLKGMNPQQSFSGLNQNAFVTARVFSLGLNLRF